MDTSWILPISSSPLQAIRSRYTLGYYPSVKQPKGKFCEINVQVRSGARKRGPLGGENEERLLPLSATRTYKAYGSAHQWQSNVTLRAGEAPSIN